MCINYSDNEMFKVTCIALAAFKIRKYLYYMAYLQINPFKSKFCEAYVIFCLIIDHSTNVN